jgi:hypothetical protein
MASGGDSGSAGQGPGGTAGSGGQGGSAGSGGNGGGAGTAGTGGGGFCVGDFLHCDDFEDGNVSDWTSSGGTWTVVNDGSFVLEGGNGSEEIYVGQQSLTDQWVTAKVKLSNWGGASSSYRAGVIARHASSSSFYAFTMAGSQEFYLHRGTSNVGGASGTCGPIATALPVGQWITLTLSVTGSGNNVHIQTYANGDPVHDCTTTSGTIGNGQPGLISVGTDTSGHFDDFKVLQP